ncbi:hypothetical protein [Ferriphaselus amnicola]|nr:hypothetical protein [Ferriphaselus amnicola]
MQEKLAEIQQVCQDSQENAVLMGAASSSFGADRPNRSPNR